MMHQILDIDKCANSFAVYEGKDRRKHVVVRRDEGANQFIEKSLQDFIKTHGIKEKRPVVVYVRSEEMGMGMVEYVKVW